MTNNSYISLKDRIYKGIFEDKQYLRELKILADKIKAKCRRADNEATVVSEVEISLHDFIRDVFNLDITPHKEIVTPTRTRLKGRIDSKIGAVIFEYKHHSKLTTSSLRNKAVMQIKEYIEGIIANNTPSTTKYTGIVTDGLVCSIIEYSLSGVTSRSFEELNELHLNTIIQNIVLSQKTALTSDNLVKDLCSNDNNSISSLLTLALYNAIKNTTVEKSQMLLTEWKQLFSLAHDDISKQTAIAKRKTALEKIINTQLSEVNDEYLVLFSLQTAYAIIIKIIAFKIVSKLRLSDVVKFSDYINYDDNVLADTMSQLENGSIFREYGIGNLLEGDFFSWYCASGQWTTEIAQYIRKIYEVLSAYEDKPIFESGDNVIDLFKELFMNIIPDDVRHSLGEYYTPMWLADNVVNEAINKLPEDRRNAWRGLDPCAGSGTFIVTMIRKVLSETNGLPPHERLHQVINRVKGVDLNPLAVLSTRINYFINIAPLISDEEHIEIPIFLGDSSYIPKEVLTNDISTLQYTINTTKGPIAILLPTSLVSDTDKFSIAMTEIETYILLHDVSGIVKILYDLLPVSEQNHSTQAMILSFAETLVDFERKQWNGIWARIVANYLTTACLGKFDIIVGNPPWVDWKTLPNNYRDRVKGLCIDNKLFSGDGITGGINLNICALITNVVGNRYLTKDGILAFLMPQTILFQSSYEGFRNCYLENGERLYIQGITDWTMAGHPFDPVQERFLTYFFSHTHQNYATGVPVYYYIKKKSCKSKISRYNNLRTFEEIADKFETKTGVIGQVNDSNTSFSYADTPDVLTLYKLIAGTTQYKGREGIEFYPQELFLLKYRGDLPKPRGGLLFENFQSTTSKYRIPITKIVLEDLYLRPLIKGKEIQKFHYNVSEWVVPFPYDDKHTRVPISLNELRRQSPKLASYLYKHKTTIDAQTNYNERIIGNKENREFYALARVGDYSMGDVFVAFRDNSKWGACVIGFVPTPWGRIARPCFQNHAVSISQYGDGRFISEEEAHYLCGILNAPIVDSYIRSSSDSRSFKVRPPVFIPEFDSNNIHHTEIAKLSRKAHSSYDKPSLRIILQQINNHYIEICKERNRY